jgi:RimJ/RimL family protein N-acetyltransferase
MWFPYELVSRQAIEQPARRRNLVIELGKQGVDEGHGGSVRAESTNARYAITMDANGGSHGDEVRLSDGALVAIRPIRPDDEPLMAAFHAGLSMRSVYQRYFHLSSLEQRITHSRLSLTCRVDPAAGLAIVADHVTAKGAHEVLALGRLTRTEPGAAEIALLGMDRWQGRGLGRAMMHALVAQARALGVRRLHGDMLADNDAMRAVVRRAGFSVQPVPGDAAVLRAERVVD